MRHLTLVLQALGHSQFKNQPTVEEVVRHLNAFIDELCREGRGTDVVWVLRRISAKPDMGVGFCRDVLMALAQIASLRDLEDEVRAYRERFGEDEFLTAFVHRISG